MNARSPRIIIHVSAFLGPREFALFNATSRTVRDALTAEREFKTPAFSLRLDFNPIHFIMQDIVLTTQDAIDDIFRQDLAAAWDRKSPDHVVEIEERLNSVKVKLNQREHVANFWDDGEFFACYARIEAVPKKLKLYHRNSYMSYVFDTIRDSELTSREAHFAKRVAQDPKVFERLFDYFRPLNVCDK